MKQLRRVVWSKGMFLTPQYFQAHDNYLEDAMQFRISAAEFKGWGFLDLAVNEEELVNGRFTVTKCRGVFPDGTLFDSSEGDDLPASRPVASFPAGQQS